MRAICLYLHIHQPFRFREYSIFEVGSENSYWHNEKNQQINKEIFKKVAKKSYHPTFDAIEKQLKYHPEFKISLSVSGTWLEQAKMWDESLINQLRLMIRTGRVEILGETYYHSLAFFYNRDEFEAQVKIHAKKIKNLFNTTCKVFRNTELAYNDSLAKWAEENGYKGILAEGWDEILKNDSPNHVYSPKNCKNLKLLLRNYQLSDDITFRFNSQNWQKYQKSLEKSLETGNLINLFMDFETFGEHQWGETGIFEFMDTFVNTWLKEKDQKFITVSEACDFEPAYKEISVPKTITWADTERNLSAWTGDKIQIEALNTLYSLQDKILETKNPELIGDFRRLTTSDQTYYMSTKTQNDGDVHSYFSIFDSPYDAFMYFMNIMRDLENRLSSF